MPNCYTCGASIIAVSGQPLARRSITTGSSAGSSFSFGKRGRYTSSSRSYAKLQVLCGSCCTSYDAEQARNNTIALIAVVGIGLLIGVPVFCSSSSPNVGTTAPAGAVAPVSVPVPHVEAAVVPTANVPITNRRRKSRVPSSESEATDPLRRKRSERANARPGGVISPLP